ncbi:uncharacterized protein PAC_04291 [Phialocephala subalpina]|uniref:Uncharacterized protein n=1 Tax=Phialocephala subalpina TaxID=576137 RepID=A0A1L7WNQ6_9HELO|nr:uncharacterized protein PAC_04291 [Phialocephala subalpina]
MMSLGSASRSMKTLAEGGSVQKVLSTTSPLQALIEEIANNFRSSPDRASKTFANIQDAVLNNTTRVRDHMQPLASFTHPWNSCKLAATLVLVLASSKDTMLEAMKFQSRSLGGLPNLEITRSTPTTSFSTAFEIAKSVALGPGKKTTILGVSLVDMHIFELAEKGQSEPWSSSLGGLPNLEITRSTPTTSFSTAFEIAKSVALGPGKKTTILGVSLVDMHIFELAEKGQSEPWSSFAHTFVVGI